MSEAVKIIFAGDTFPVPNNIALFQAGDTEALFGSRVVSLFQSADYSVCNLEGCLTDTGEPIEKIGPLVKAPTDCLRALKKLGIKAATLANTHTLDCGKTGHDEMRAALEKYGIEHFGTGDNEASIKRYITLNIKGRIIILYTVTELFAFNTPGEDSPGANGYDEYEVCRELSALKKQCDHLVVLYHGGVEISHYNTPVVRRRFHRMADSGADIIISQHTHAIGLEEKRGGAYLLYGQGNFCFNLSPKINEFNCEGFLLEVLFSDDGFSVKKHLLKRTELGSTYNEAQDFSAFDERSRLHDRLLSGDKYAKHVFEQEYDRIGDRWFPELMRLFRGINPEDDANLKDKSSQAIINYLTDQYSKRQLMGLKMAVTNDEFNEITSHFLQMAIDKKG